MARMDRKEAEALDRHLTTEPKWMTDDSRVIRLYRTAVIEVEVVPGFTDNTMAYIVGLLANSGAKEVTIQWPPVY